MNEESKIILVGRLSALGYEAPSDNRLKPHLYRPGTFDILEKTDWLVGYEAEDSPNDDPSSDFEHKEPEVEYKVRLMLRDLDDERSDLEAASAESRTRGVIHRTPPGTPGYVVWR